MPPPAPRVTPPPIAKTTTPPGETVIHQKQKPQGIKILNPVAHGFGFGRGLLLLGVVLAAIVPVGLFLLFTGVLVIGAGDPDVQDAVREFEESVQEIEDVLTSTGPATLAEFNRITNGMSYSQVASIIGSEGELMSSSYIEGVSGAMNPIDTSMYTWKGSGGLGANMNAMFRNDKLITKAQFGLQ